MDGKLNKKEVNYKMSKINIRESLNRLDLQTDNKYDLRNTYDCSNISDDKKKKLAEALNKNASAKEVSKLLSEDYDDFDPKYDARYEVNSYYANNYSGLEDDLYTNDFEEVKDWVWEKCQKGLYINVVDRETGNQVNINPENYDWESDDAYRILDDLEEVSPLNEEYEDDVDNSQYLDTNDSYRTEVSSELRSFLRSIEKGKSWDEALVNLGYECVDPGCIGWSKETEDGEIYVSFENLDDEGTIENSKINFAMFDKNGDVVEEDSFDFRMRESLKEGLDEEQLYKIVCKSGASEWPFESALSYEDAGKIVDYYNGRWIDERGFEWSMEIEEDDESTEHAMVDNTYDMEDDDERAQRECVESLNEAIKDINSLHSKIWNMDNNEKICFPNGYCVKCEFYDREGKAKRYIVTDKEDNVIIKGKFGFAWQPQIKKFEEDFFNLLNGHSVDESLKEGLGEVSGDFAFARKNWDKLGTGVSFDDALEEYNDKYGEEYFYAKPIYVKSAWNKMVSMFAESLKEDYDDKKSVEFSDFWIWAKTKDGKWELYDATSEQEDVSNSLRNAKADKRFVDTKVTKNGERPDGTKNYNVLTSESLKEAIEDEVDFEEELGYFGEVEEGVSFFEDGKEWTWKERIAGPVHIDFDNWAVWSAYDEAEVDYFVVDEDTGFIDWGPVENQTEAQDFLNGKVSDWEKETNFRHPMHNDLFDESLKESKDIKDDGYEVTIHYDDIGNENNSEYDYKLDRDDFLKGMCVIVEDDEDAPENYDMRLEWVEDNLEKLIDKYEINILDYFLFDAQEDEYNSRENFYEPEYDPFEKD